MVGGGHSHDTKYPDDTWNLYAMLDADAVTALNVTRPRDTIGIFKPHVHRFDEEPSIISDADAEVIVLITFTSPCSVRKIMIMGGGDEAHHPSRVKLYPNRVTLDFTELDAVRAAQELELPVNSLGVVELTTVLQPFTNITSLALYFPSNHGDSDVTRIKYIGMQGEHTHYKREAVDTVYEVLCNGQDIHQPEDAHGSTTDLNNPHLH